MRKSGLGCRFIGFGVSMVVQGMHAWDFGFRP